MLIPLLALGALAQVAASDGQAHVRRFANDRVELLKSMTSDPQLVKAIQEKNAAGESMDEVRRIDQQWLADSALPLRKALTGNACAGRARELTARDASIVEVIVMDRQGANVCITKETSDYWQGDEAKFQRTFGQSRELFIDAPAFDASTGVYAVQLSATVFEGAQPIGAVTITLRVPRAPR